MSKSSNFIASLEKFVNSLNVEGIKAEEVVEKIKIKESTLHGNAVDFFRNVVYNELWCEPDSLRQRRINGELDKLFMDAVRAARGRNK